MQAALHKAGSPQLQIVNDFPIPKPGPTEVLLKIKASGVCHTDVYLLSQFASDPRTYILGHEASGVVVGRGDKVNHNITDNQLYAVLSLGGCATGALSVKLGSKTITIADFSNFGIGVNGSHAQFAIVDQSHLVPVPKGVSPEQAAGMADAGMTVFHAIRHVANIKKGDKVLVFGVGGLGLLAVQIAKHFGAEVFALDIKPTSRELAKRFGAVEVFDLEELDAKTAKGFTVDLVLDFVATSTSFERDIAVLQNNSVITNLRKGGRIILVGISDEDLRLNAVQFVGSEISVLTSLYGTRQDLIDVLDLVAQGAINPVIESAPLDQVNEVMNALRANEVLSRKVLLPPGSQD